MFTDDVGKYVAGVIFVEHLIISSVCGWEESLGSGTKATLTQKWAKS